MYILFANVRKKIHILANILIAHDVDVVPLVDEKNVGVCRRAQEPQRWRWQQGVEEIAVARIGNKRNKQVAAAMGQGLEVRMGVLAAAFECLQMVFY